MKNRKSFGNLILLFTAFIWGMAFAFQRKAAAIMGPFSVSAGRMSLAALEVGILYCVLAAGRKARGETLSPKKRKASLKGGLICGLCMGAGSILQQTGLGTTSAGKSGFLTALYIVMVPLLSGPVRKKKVSRQVWAAVGIALVGLWLLTGGGGGFTRGDLALLCCALAFSLQILAADAFDGDPVLMAEVQFLLVTAISWVLAVLLEKPTIGQYRAALIPLLYCGCISGGVGYTLQLVGQKYADPAPASLCMSFESVFSVLGGAMLLGEHLSLREGIGCAVMFAAILLVQGKD